MLVLFSLLTICSHLSPIRPQFCYTSKLPDICRQFIFSLAYSSRFAFGLIKSFTRISKEFTLAL